MIKKHLGKKIKKFSEKVVQITWIIRFNDTDSDSRYKMINLIIIQFLDWVSCFSGQIYKISGPDFS